jgi:5'-3' exonuclease
MSEPDNNAPILLLVDGSSYLYRAYHALPDLRGPEGFPTGAIHGFIAMMSKLRGDVGAGHAVCVFDASGPTFRDEWYDQYKANRSPMPDDLRLQIAPIHEVVQLLGWPILEVPGIEADDAIGTLACVGATHGHRVIISTGDKDMAQLVNDKVTLINTMSNERLDVEGVKAKFGVPPDRIVDYLTLIGDAVDNVPGVDKVGPKTAAKWIAEHGSLDGVIAAAGSIKGVAGDNLRKALDWLRLRPGAAGAGMADDRAAGAARGQPRRAAGLLWPLWLPRVAQAIGVGHGPGPGRGALGGSARRGRCTDDAPVRDQAPLRAHLHDGAPAALDRPLARRAAGRAGHGDRFARPDARAHRRHLLRRHAGRGGLRAAVPQLRRCTGPVAHR